MKNKKLLAIILLSLSFCFASGVVYGVVIQPEKPSVSWSIGEAASVISAIIAVIVFIISIVIYFLKRRKKRPVILLSETKVESPLKTKHLFLKFKNVGKNPAQKVKIHMYGCPKKDPLTVKKVGSIHIVNQKDPGMSFPWKVEVRISDYIKSVDFLFYIGLTYEDIFTKKHYPSELWLIHKTGEFELKDMDIKECRKMKEVMEKIRFYQDHQKKLKWF